ncbi:response regulator [Glaciecola petra]|uniref:Response regulator n=1 Tax=Glaciecola petra TaxID=3075602 RepID=A0ABU2ZP83_9ALTE|nr:response regulator [Aestuariibacter sp. P117]MDT0594438.1 response regulator [Aestuariibacter sp. P117]
MTEASQLLPTAEKSRQSRLLRIAIVEDNATARTNLRGHLMAIEQFDIASYSNGNELKNGLRLANFDLVLMDFHLGQSKTGVEWILQLQEQGLFKASTGLVFVTSDGMPQTIGQILDLHPDFIIIKPYTMRSLRLNMIHYLRLRKEIQPVLDCMSRKDNLQALNIITHMLKGNVNKRFKNDFLKMRGRLLMAEKQYPEAISLYSDVLKKSSNILWAHWGLIKSEFFTGRWQQCQKMLNHLISESLTKDKAFEWMASLSIGKKDYHEAARLLDNIKDSELSIQATRLKVFAYKMLDKSDLAQALLEKKVQNNLSVKDRMFDYALELARFHIQMAEHLVNSDDHVTLSQEDYEEQRLHKLIEARKLIGKANRGQADRQSETQKNYMLALAYTIEGDQERAEKLIHDTNSIGSLSKANTSTLIDAVKVWFGLGNSDKANEILAECDEQLLVQENHIERLICAELVSELEETYHIEKDRALAANDKGMKLYNAREYSDAIACFHKAYSTFPGVPAFSLNLLQCLGDLEQQEFKGLLVDHLLQELETVTLNEKNQKRLARIKVKLGR